MNEVARLPKLRIKLPAGNQSEIVLGLEQARNLLNFEEGVIMAEGQTVYSYDALLELATHDSHKDKEYLEVKLLQVIEGG